MEDWKIYFQQGKDQNSCENYEQAVKLLEAALEGCPDSDSSIAGNIIFEIGRSFFGLGMRGIAVKNMIAAVKMGIEEPHTKNMLNCLLNEYGMPAKSDKKLDDEAAFTAIHVMRYLYTKKSGRFGTLAERDMIFELVSDAWKDCCDRNDFSELNTREKIAKFREFVIFFPSLTVPDLTENKPENIRYVDFGNDLCACGSGLPYMWCCGRIKSIDELKNGLF